MSSGNEDDVMRIARVFAFILVLMAALVASVQPSEAEDRRSSWLRVDDPLLIGAVERGARESPTFKALLDRLEESDLIVYMMRKPAIGLSPHGRTQFVVRAGSYRFVRVTIRADQVTRAIVALVGHELQHVAELADEPLVGDSDSYLNLYRRIGYSSCDSLCHCFDTQAAVDAGYAVLSELGRGRHRVPVAAVVADSRVATREHEGVLSLRASGDE
jgi:hypothetical protein